MLRLWRQHVRGGHGACEHGHQSSNLIKLRAISEEALPRNQNFSVVVGRVIRRSVFFNDLSDQSKMIRVDCLDSLYLEKFEFKFQGSSSRDTYTARIPKAILGPYLELGNCSDLAGQPRVR